jgi:hypothetical protein
MVKTSFPFIAVLAATSLLAACSSCSRNLDPCPAGMKVNKAEDRCVPITSMDPAHGPDGGDDDTLDASMPETPEAGPEMPSEDMDASAHDASTSDARVDAGFGDAGADGGETIDAGDPSTQTDAGPVIDECSATDSDAWSAFHIAPGLVSQIGQCAADPICAGGPCSFDACLREAAAVTGCNECVAAEVQCMSQQCASACGASSTDADCLTCACEQGCTLEFATCAAASRGETCDDCDADICESNMSVLPPELIMTVLYPVLFQPVMMPVMP